MFCTDRQVRLISPMVLFFMTAIASVSAYSVDLNYESLSSLEEPIAIDVHDITISLNGLFDSGIRISDVSDNDLVFDANVQLGLDTQLPNSLRVGARYFGSYSDNDLAFSQSYQDNAALFIGGVWGTVALGNVTGLVREQTRRRRGEGNAELAFDDHLAQLDDVGISYLGRFGPNQLSITVDKEGGYELGSSYQRPLGNKDYRFSLRFRDSELALSNQALDSLINSTAVFNSQALGVVAELTFGSNVFDVGVGYEQLSNGQIEATRRFASFGAGRKRGVWSLSGEAHLGDIDGHREASYALGIRYDIARGLSLNAGLNYSDAIITLGNSQIINDADTVGRVSLRYGF